MGLGGDVDTTSFEVSESRVVAPSEMIMLGDSIPGDGSKNAKQGAFDGNIDPTTRSEWPSNRHGGRTVTMFCDGHAESALRRLIIDPKSVWHRRWNNDNTDAGSWTVDAKVEASIDP